MIQSPPGPRLARGIKHLYAALRRFAARTEPPRFGDGSTFRTAEGADGSIVLQRRVVVAGPFADGRRYRLAWRTLKACTVADLARAGAFCDAARTKLPGIDEVIVRGGGVAAVGAIDRSGFIAQRGSVSAISAIAFACFFALTHAASPALSQSRTRAPSSCVVIDGDTISCRDVRIRFANADAPEFGRRAGCAEERELGTRAKEYVEQRLTQARRISVELDIERPRDTYGRLLARVRVDGRDIGAELVAAGLAKPHSIGGNAVTRWCASAVRRK